MLFGDFVIWAVGLALLGVAAYLMFQRGFWIVAFGVGGLAACFATLASIIHFQILGALGYCAVMVGCWAVVLKLLMDINEKQLAAADKRLADHRRAEDATFLDRLARSND